jgi:hypothetical protein
MPLANRRKKSSRRSGKCPEPFNTLIDIAGGIAMNAVANKMEQKHQYHKRGVPNPYKASAYGIASGRMKSTEDIIRLGGALGAMGAFEADADPSRVLSSADVSWKYDNVAVKTAPKNSNRYAWRLNCEDGSQFGLSPESFETRKEYNEALSRARGDEPQTPVVSSNVAFQAHNDHESSSDCGKFIFCRISRLDNGDNQYFLSSSSAVKVGDLVVVPTDSGTTQGVVLSVEHHTAESAPQPLDETKTIIG